MSFTLEEFLDEIRYIKWLEYRKEFMEAVLGPSQSVDSLSDIDADKRLPQMEAVISAMTTEERQHPERIDEARRRRIADRAGVEPSDVQYVLVEFRRMFEVDECIDNLSTLLECGDQFRYSRNRQNEWN